MPNGSSEDSPAWQEAIHKLSEEYQDHRRRDREEIEVLTETVLALQRQNTYLWKRVSRLRSAEAAHGAITAAIDEEPEGEAPDGIPEDYQIAP